MAKNLFQLILASQSPRRKDLLSQFEINFQIQPANINEEIPFESPSALVKELAHLKAKAIWEKQQTKNKIIIGADTVVAMDNKILGKPVSREEANQFMHELSNKEHEVLSGVCLLGDEIFENFSVCTKVKFRSLTQNDIDLYLAKNEYQDKAGGYGIQGAASVFVESLEGSYSNVVGLPQAQLINSFEKTLGRHWREVFE